MIHCMTDITLDGTPVHTHGSLPTVGTKAPGFTLVGNDLSPIALADFAGSRLILNIFPSVDTGICATSVRTFNERAAGLENTKVLCISVRAGPFLWRRGDRERDGRIRFPHHLR